MGEGEGGNTCPLIEATRGCGSRMGMNSETVEDWADITENRERRDRAESDFSVYMVVLMVPEW